jgi:hypothetical protein
VALADPAVAPTLLFGRSKLFKGIKVNIRSEILFSSDSVCVSKILVKTGMQRKSNETIQFVSLFQNYVVHHVYSRSLWSQSRIALWLRLYKNDAAPAPQPCF